MGTLPREGGILLLIQTLKRTTAHFRDVPFGDLTKDVLASKPLDEHTSELVSIRFGELLKLFKEARD